MTSRVGASQGRQRQRQHRRQQLSLQHENHGWSIGFQSANDRDVKPRVSSLYCRHACAGVVRGCGRQLIGAITNLISYWVLGLPLAALLAFRFELGVHGLWTGLLVATTVQVSILEA